VEVDDDARGRAGRGLFGLVFWLVRGQQPREAGLAEVMQLIGGHRRIAMRREIGGTAAPIAQASPVLERRTMRRMGRRVPSLASASTTSGGVPS